MSSDFKLTFGAVLYSPAIPLFFDYTHYLFNDAANKTGGSDKYDLHKNRLSSFDIYG